MLRQIRPPLSERLLISLLQTVVPVVCLVFLVPELTWPQMSCEGSSKDVPHFEHVIVLVEENQSYKDVLEGPSMPYLKELASTGAKASQYYANTHPSINNYFFLTAGRKGTKFPWIGPLADKYPGEVSGENVASILTKHGKTWKVYAEDLPGNAFHDQGLYVKRHNPFAYFKSVLDDKPGTGQSQRDNIVPFPQFATDWKGGNLPDYSFIIPNLVDDAHNKPEPNSHKRSECGGQASLKHADGWLEDKLKPLVESDDFRRSGLLVIVFDEACDHGKDKDNRKDGDHTSGGGGLIPAVLVSPKVRSGYASDTLFHHQSVLRLSLEALGIDEYPADKCDVPSMSEFFSENAHP